VLFAHFDHFGAFGEDAHQLLHFDRLDDEVIDPRIDRIDEIIGFVVGGDDDRVHLGIFLAYLFEHLQTVHVGHRDVGDHQIDLPFITLIGLQSIHTVHTGENPFVEHL
jgi:hypothetical protein